MRFFNLHTHHFINNHDILELVNQYPNQFDNTVPNYSIGIHPWYIIENETDDYFKIIENKLKSEKCLAVGECGLDKRIEIPMETQILIFEKHLLLAQKNDKAVVIHCVGAFNEIIQIKKKLNITIPLVIHGFSKNIETCKMLINNGFYISFGKYLLQNPELEKVFQSVPNDKFFLETDTINDSIGNVYKLAAQYKSIDLNNLHQIIHTNFETVFKKKIQ